MRRTKANFGRISIADLHQLAAGHPAIAVAEGINGRVVLVMAAYGSQAKSLRRMRDIARTRPGDELSLA